MGTIVCWGKKFSGQLGNGTHNEEADTPVSVVGIGTATAIAAGGDTSCALLEDATVWCWGGNFSGQLGNGEAGYSPFPVEVIDLFLVPTNKQ